MKINPCPYCSEKERVSIVGVGFDGSLSCVECDACGARGRWYGSPREAADRWNDISLANGAHWVEMQNELAAYNKLSGGKTAIEYAMWVDKKDRVIRDALLVLWEGVTNVFPNQSIAIAVVEAAANIVGVKLP